MGNPDFANRLADARSRLHLTQVELAAASDIAATQISRYETRRAKPRPDVAKRLAAALAVDLEWLLSGKEAPENEKTPGGGEPASNLVLRATADTARRWGEIISRTGLAPESLFRRMVLEFEAQTEARYGELLHRIERLEQALGGGKKKDGKD